MKKIVLGFTRIVLILVITIPSLTANAITPKGERDIIERSMKDTVN